MRLCMWIALIPISVIVLAIAGAPASAPVIAILFCIFGMFKLRKGKPKKEVDLSDCESIDFKVAGVTFNNDNGTSRQHYLKWYKKLDEPRITFQEFKYQGKPAIHVLCEKNCIGNVPADIVKDVLDVLKYIKKTYCDIGSFEDERGETIYFAKIRIWYRSE